MNHLRSLLLTAGLVLVSGGALADTFTLSCKSGARVTTEFGTYDGGVIAFATDPDIVSATCRKDNDAGPTVYVMPGLPGDFPNLATIKAEVKSIRDVLGGSTLKGVSKDALPPAMKFVREQMDVSAAAEARKKAAKAN